MSTDRTRSVAVVGAGPYGIAAARALRDLGHEPIVFESGAKPGETWRCRHDRLHLNTIRWLSNLPGTRMPRRFGTFPARNDFVQYLDDAAADLDVRTSCPVDRIDRRGGTWVIPTPDASFEVSDVIVATGPDTEPVMPHWPGEDGFTGALVHAAEFDRLADADGRRVVVVGPGNSGVDLMNHLVDGDAVALTMSARRGMNILPARMFGLPTHPMAVAGRRLPAGVQDTMMRSLQQAAFGDLTEYGYPPSELGVLARIDRDQVAPAIDDGFVDGLKAGRIAMRPAIERFDGDTVVYEDGSTETPDVVVCATGYRPGLDALVGHLVDLDEFGFPRLTGEHRHDDVPGLWFFGMQRDPYGNLSVLRARTRRLRRELADEFDGRPERGSPRRVTQQLEAEPHVPDSEDVERFHGFGVMGVPFECGDVLAMRRFPGSSIGPGYTSVWHRAPDGRWVIYQDQNPMVACPRVFGPAIDDAITTDISMTWTGPEEFVIEIDEPHRLRWKVGLVATPATRALSAIASATPERIRQSRMFAAIAGRLAGPILRAGRLRLVGEVPSQQGFLADLQHVWAIDQSRAMFDGRDVGAPAPLPEQVHLGDFWIPQRALFAAGDALFESYDPTRHLHCATRSDAGSA